MQSSQPYRWFFNVSKYIKIYEFQSGCFCQEISTDEREQNIEHNSEFVGVKSLFCHTLPFFKLYNRIDQSKTEKLWTLRKSKICEYWEWLGSTPPPVFWISIKYWKRHGIKWGTLIRDTYNTASSATMSYS